MIIKLLPRFMGFQAGTWLEEGLQKAKIAYISIMPHSADK